jgi:hypothetical protein
MSLLFVIVSVEFIGFSKSLSSNISKRKILRVRELAKQFLHRLSQKYYAFVISKNHPSIARPHFSVTVMQALDLQYRALVGGIGLRICT